MEENVSPELSLAPVPEQSQDRLDSCSQGVQEDGEQRETLHSDGDDVPEEALEEPDAISEANSRFKKTWGFRRSTVARREMPVEASTNVRRSGRQAKRTDKLEEFLLTAKRGTRRSAPPTLESPPSQSATDPETASEASFDGNADTKSPERKTRSSTRKQTQRKTRSVAQTRRRGGSAANDHGSSENEEEEEEGGDDGKTDHTQDDEDDGEQKDEKNNCSSAEVQSSSAAEAPPELSTDTKAAVEQKDEHVDEEAKDESDEDSDDSEEEPAALVKRGPIRTYVNKKRAAKSNASPDKAAPANKSATPPQAAGKAQKANVPDEGEESSSSSSSSESDGGGYDPNALYCICRQKHNKRFMICCDRCEEWFHGDCVGITEARGRLMERNGEDYVCPNCTAKKSQVVRPATCALAASAEAVPSRAGPPSAAAEKSTVGADGAALGVPTVATPPSSTPAAGEERSSEDAGIKGRIEKATNPSGKKKIKIFQPAVQRTAEPKAERKTSAAAEAAASGAEAGTAAAAAGKALPKCIGPGCKKPAQPDSVYCGSDCIVRHATAAMKSMTDVKDPEQQQQQEEKEAEKPTSTPKKSVPGGKKRQKTARDESDAESDGGRRCPPDGYDTDEEDAQAVEQRPSPDTESWRSDHSYIAAVAPVKTAAISAATVLNAPSPPKEEKQSETEQKEKERSPSPEKPPSAPVTRNKSQGRKKSPPAVAAKVSPKGKKGPGRPSGSKTKKKPPPPPPSPPKPAAKPKKPTPSASKAPPQGPIHATGAVRVMKTSFTIPKKQPQQKDSHSNSTSSSSKVPSSSVSSTPSSHSSYSSSSSSRPSHSTPALTPPPSNDQMRKNIRRSLTDILYKRVCDSDDLKMNESEVAKLAISIEKEMFNLCLGCTDSKYKNKYRSLMFNLKDPKNKGLFYRVMGCEVSPFRLVRLSAEEMLSKEISEWKKPDPPESPSTRAGSGASRPSNKHDSLSADAEDAPPASDDLEESGSTPSGSAQSSAADGVGKLPDILSNMLKDTTAEHKTHLFDLNCKICTGQKSEDEPAAKKAKLIKKPESKPDVPRVDETSLVGPPQDPVVSQHQLQDPSPFQQPLPEPLPPPQQQQLYQEELSVVLPPVVPPVPVVPAVSSVTITRRDPRMARHSSSVTVAHPHPAPIEKPVVIAAEPLPAPVVAPSDVGPKGPLPLPPALPSPVAVFKSAKTSTAEPPLEGETAIFLHGQEKIWKGFINMQSVAKFVTKAFLVSGSFEHLKEDLPDTIHIGGRISPSTVWDYVGKLKTSLSRELCLIRFHPATEEEEVAYVSLFSYFSSRKRFGVVANNNRRIKDLYLIPLASKDPLPSKLLPFDGPGLEPARPNLLLGLLICQKDRKRSGAPVETEEKRSKTQTKDSDDTGLPKVPLSVKADRSVRHSLELPFSTTPPGSPPSAPSEASGSHVTPSPIISALTAAKAPPTSAPSGVDSPSSSNSSSAAAATPLQTILNLLKKTKHDSDASNSPSEQGAEPSVPAASLLDPIVKQYAQTPKGAPVEDEDEDDRPYDPEEEYDPSRGFHISKTSTELVIKPVLKQPEAVPGEVDDVAYDPEDDSIFDDVGSSVPAPPEAAATVIPDPQKILESLKRIGEQTLQKKEEVQISAVPVSGASETRPDLLLTPPPKSLLANSQLLQLGKKVEELVKSSAIAPLINQKRDPRQSRDPRQTVAGLKSTDEPAEKEETSAVVPDFTSSSEPQVSDGAEQENSSQGEVSAPPQEEEDTDETPMESEEAGVSIPLLGERVEPDMESSYLDQREEDSEEEEPVEAKTVTDKFSVWPNAASILKTSTDSDYDENSREAPVSFYREPENTHSITSTIPVLTHSTIAEAPPHHIPHHRSMPGEYRPPADVPPLSSFPPPGPMPGSNIMMRPPPMSVPPPMQGLPPMQGPLPMQGHLPPLHVPPPVRAPPPMQGDGSQPYGPPASYPPYQNQWPGSQPPPQQQPPQNIMIPRGPPPSFPPVPQRGPPQMFDPSIPPQHTGQPGPPLRLPPHPTFDGQSGLPPPRFAGPPPPFSFPANRGPPPPFPVPPPGHFDNRLPPMAHFPGPRGAPPSQYGDVQTKPPMVDQPRGPAEQFNKDPANSYKLNMDQNPDLHNIFKDNQVRPAGPAFRGPPTSPYEDRRGPPPSGEVSGIERFNLHPQYGSSRPHASPPHRGSFDEHRDRGPPPHESRLPSSLPFGGSERYRFDRHSDEARPIHHGGSLLPTPPESSLLLPARIGGHSPPDLHREDHWRRHSPEMRRRSSSAQEEPEGRSADHFSRFDGGVREPPMGLSQPPEERPRDLSEDRRREREREAPHPGRTSWDRGQGKRWSREREWDRGKERERDGERSRERDRSRGRERDGERHREKEGERQREKEGERQREKEGERQREKEGERQREKEGERQREKEGERQREKEGDRQREKEGERHREQETDKRRERDREREKDREKEKERERPRERDTDRRDPDRDRARNRERERERDRDRDRDRERDRERDRHDRDRDRRRERSRSKERSRDRDRGKERGRDRDRDKDKDKDKDRERERDRDKDRDRDRQDSSRSREKREEKKDGKHESTKEGGRTEDKSGS